jgi:hypothetical protein
MSVAESAEELGEAAVTHALPSDARPALAAASIERREADMRVSNLISVNTKRLLAASLRRWRSQLPSTESSDMISAIC